MQFDLFNDSHNVVLRNDVIHALEQWDAAAAGSAWETLRQQYPHDDCLNTLRVLITAVAGRARMVFQNHDLLRSARGSPPGC